MRMLFSATAEAVMMAGCALARTLSETFYFQSDAILRHSFLPNRHMSAQFSDKWLRRIPAALSLLFGLGLHNACGETVYTGDVIQGVRVISRLDVSDLAPGTKYRFLFQGIEMGTGQHWYVPVMVAKGVNAGRKVLLGSGVHGDELSPTDVVQRAFGELDPAHMSGTVLAVLDMSRLAKELVQRKWPTPLQGGSLIDMNRVWPGSDTGNLASRHAHLLWNNLFTNNIDAALDFHTAATGADFTLFIFADFRNPEVRQLAELFPVEQIKEDPGLDGTLETALVKAGIPAITVEVGGPRAFDGPKILASAEGVRNVLAHYGITDAKVGRTASDSQAFIGNDLEVIRSSTGGFVELLVKLGERVKPGQKLAIQRNSFGDIVEQYMSDVDGEIAILGTDAVREPGADIAEILVNRTDQKCPDGGCPYAGDNY